MVRIHAGQPVFFSNNEQLGLADTVLTQEATESEDEVKFPKRSRHQGKVLATIYSKSRNYPLYRVAWTVAGKRRMETFPRYGEARRRADALVRELTKGHKSPP